MPVVCIDPAPAKKSTIFDGSAYHRVDAAALRQYLDNLASGTLLCWDAPLTGPANPANAGKERYDFTKRPIEQFFSQEQSGFKTPKGISVRAYSGLPHWTITRSMLGLPRTGPYDYVLLLFHLLPDPNPELSDRRPSVAEIHPAVAAWLWCKGRRPSESWNYKDNDGIRRELWKIILERSEVSWSEKPTPESDDEFDAAIGYILGCLYLCDRQKPTGERRVDFLGDQATGSFLLPMVPGLVNSWRKFKPT